MASQYFNLIGEEEEQELVAFGTIGRVEGTHPYLVLILE